MDNMKSSLHFVCRLILLCLCVPRSDRIRFALVPVFIDDLAHGGGEGGAGHVLAGDGGELFVQLVGGVVAVGEAAGAQDGPGEGALAQGVFGFGLGGHGFAQGLFEHIAHQRVLFAAAHAGDEDEAGFGGVLFEGADDVEVAGGVAADALFVFAADKADDGVGQVLLHGLGDGFCVKCVGNGGADVLVGEKFVGLLFGQP